MEKATQNQKIVGPFLLDTFKSWWPAPLFYLSTSHFSISHLSLTYPLEQREPAVGAAVGRRLAGSRPPPLLRGSRDAAVAGAGHGSRPLWEPAVGAAMGRRRATAATIEERVGCKVRGQLAAGRCWRSVRAAAAGAGSGSLCG